MADEKKEFVVKDRRVFSEAEDGEKDVKENEDGPEKAKAEETQEAPDTHPQMPEINFPTFLISLNASAMVNLGLLEDPASGKKSKNLAMAKQTIDILSMLEEKTRGNLTGDEEKILKDILYDLRINFVRAKE